MELINLPKLIINRNRRVKTNIIFGNDFSTLFRAFESHALINDYPNLSNMMYLYANFGFFF